MTDRTAARSLGGRGRLRLLLAGLALLVACSVVAGAHLLRQRILKDQCLERWYAIQLAILRLGIDEKPLPSDLTALVADGYLEAWPLNPYTQRPMMAVLPDDNPEPGDFSAIVVTFPARPREKFTFHIVGYGKWHQPEVEKDFPGVLPDNAVVVLESGHSLGTGG